MSVIVKLYPNEHDFQKKKRFTVYFTTQFRNLVFSVFEHVLSRLSNVMNIMNFATGKLYFAKQSKVFSNIY